MCSVNEKLINKLKEFDIEELPQHYNYSMHEMGYFDDDIWTKDGIRDEYIEGLWDDARLIDLLMTKTYTGDLDYLTIDGYGNFVDISYEDAIGKIEDLIDRMDDDDLLQDILDWIE